MKKAFLAACAALMLLLPAGSLLALPPAATTASGAARQGAFGADFAMTPDIGLADTSAAPAAKSVFKASAPALRDRSSSGHTALRDIVCLFAFHPEHVASGILFDDRISGYRQPIGAVSCCRAPPAFSSQAV